jgi:16S rRNA (guanine527-N7)-methyltransferase
MREAIATAFERVGFALDDGQAAAFAEYASLLEKWNARMNLTSVRDPDEYLDAHFTDSALVLRHVDVAHGARVADIGSGAGFPGAPIAILRPDVHITLIESAARKASFLHALKSALRLDRLAICCERVDPGAVPDRWTHAFDGVVSRYTASVEWVAQCAQAMTGPDGWCAVHKYDDVDEQDALSRVGRWAGVAAVRWSSDPGAAPRRRFACVEFRGSPTVAATGA